jgi:hypothetical protein
MTAEERQRLTTILKVSHDRDELETAAAALAASEDPTAHADLGEFLASAEALARLDDLTSSSFKMSHLTRVFLVLEQHPTPSSAELCLRLIREPAFLAEDDRKIYLLPALAAVRPMSAAAAEVFRETNLQGYYNLNVRLLVQNGSPNALAVFEEMIRDYDVPAERRVDAVHAAVLPRRTELPVLQTAERLLFGVDNDVVIGVIETIFDNRSREWFGPARNPPAPPPWDKSSDDVLEFVLTIADKAEKQLGLPKLLLDAINNTVTDIREILASRRI